jgi:hypothetical protein
MQTLEERIEHYYYSRADSGEDLEEILESFNLDPCEVFIRLYKMGLIDVEIYEESSSEGCD